MPNRPITIALLAVLLAVPAASAQTVATWTGATGNWTDPALWSPAVPNNGTPPGATYNAVLTGGGTVTLNTPIVVDQLLYRAGSVAGPNSLTLNAPLTWAGGAFTGGSSIVANGGATITGTTASLRLDGGGLTLGGAASTWSSGAIQLNNGGSLTNAVGSVMTATGNDSITRLSSGAVSFTNNGTFRKQGSTGTTTIGPNVSFTNTGTVDVQTGALNIGPNAAFTNTGTVNVQTGTLNFDFGGSTTGSSSGAFTVASGATLQFSFPTAAGAYILGAGSSLSGPGQFVLSGVPNPLGGTGNVSLQGTLDIGAINVTAGNLVLANSGRVGSLSLSPPTSTNAGLFVGQTLTVTGPMTWAGGIISGGNTLAPDLNLMVNGGAAFTGSNLTLDNSIHLTLNGGSSTFSANLTISGGNSTLTNAAGSTLTANGSITLRNVLNYVASFENAGALRIQGHTTVGSGSGRFVNSGSLDLLLGSTLTVSGSTSLMNSGTVTVGAGATLSGPVANSAGSVLRGTGTLSGGPVSFAAGSTLVTGVGGPGVLATAGPIAMAAGATFRADLNGTTPGTTYGRLDLGTAGTIDLGGATLSTSLGYQPTLGPTGDALDILFGTGSGTQVTGTFANAPPGSVVYIGTFNGTDYGARVTYTTNSVILDSFQIIAAPEPGALALAAAPAAMGMVGWVRRRWKSRLNDE
jgi:hypothetical protein